MFDEYGFILTPPVPTMLIYCKDLATAAKLQAVVKEGSVTTYPGMPLPPDQMFDIGVLTFEPVSKEDRTYFHGTFSPHLRPEAEIIWTIA